MQQKQIQVGNKKLLALDMPEDCVNPCLGDYDHDHLYFELVWANNRGGDGCELPYDPKKNREDFKIIGFKNDITEEQWMEIVPCYGIERYHNFKAPTQYEEYLYKTAKESGLSLLQANNIDYLNCLIIQVI